MYVIVFNKLLTFFISTCSDSFFLFFFSAVVVETEWRWTQNMMEINCTTFSHFIFAAAPVSASALNDGPTESEAFVYYNFYY